MKFLKDGETDLDTLRKICGEMINIEAGKICYRDGSLVATDGQAIYYESGDTKYEFQHHRGVIYVPTNWSKDEIGIFADLLFNLLEDEFSKDHLNKMIPMENNEHSTVSIPMMAVRNYHIADKERVECSHGFTWVMRPMDDMLNKDTWDIGQAIETFASIVYDKFDVFNVEDNEIKDDPGIKDLRIADQLHSLKKTHITLFKHTEYFFPFLKYLSARSFSNNLDDARLPVIDFPTNDINAIDGAVSKCAACHYCTYGQIYLAKFRSKYSVYCPVCVHGTMFNTIPRKITHISTSPLTVGAYMNKMGISKIEQEVYKETAGGVKKIKVGDKVQPGKCLYKIGDKFIGVQDAHFRKFIFTKRAIEVAKLGILTNVDVYVVR